MYPPPNLITSSLTHATYLIVLNLRITKLNQIKWFIHGNTHSPSFQVGRIKERDPSTTEKMLCGAISGLVAQSLTYPLDVIRRRMQTIGIVQTSTGSTLSSPSLVLDVGPGRRAVATNSSAIVMEGEIAAKPLSMLHTVRQVVQEQGIRGFYKGVTLNWFKGPIAFSISFTTFDLMKDLLQG